MRGALSTHSLLSRLRLLGLLVDLDARRRTQRPFDITIDDELRTDESSGHDHPGTEAGEETLGASLLGERDQTVDGRALGTMALVDLREQGIGRLMLVSDVVLGHLMK